MASPTQCAIAGGGPAGLLLGLLLARAGVRVVVLEKHADFLRDFRGDTIHPSTLQVMAELGLVDDLLALPHRDVDVLRVATDDGTFALADFRRLRGRFRYLTFLPQWDFLDLLAQHARQLPTFRLLMEAEVTGVLAAGTRISGVRWRDRDGSDHELPADLTVAADGRGSAVRAAVGLVPRRFGAPMDVLWFRVSRRDGDPPQSGGRLGAGELLVRIDRGTYWQLAYAVPKHGYAGVRRLGLDAFRSTVAGLEPFLADRTDEIASWEDVKVLDVQVDRLRRWWRPGLICLGDAAHAMSPIGGVGINLAVQDAVAAARFLATPLRSGRSCDDVLPRIQRRRLPPTVATQALQRAVQRGFVSPLLAGRRRTVPRALRLLDAVPALQVVPAYVVGMGFRTEHVG